MDPFHKTLIPLDSWVTQGIDWVVVHFRPLFQWDPHSGRLHSQHVPAVAAGYACASGDHCFLVDRHRQMSSAGMGIATLVSLIAIGAIGALVTGNGHAGAGADRTAVLCGHRPAAGDLAGTQPAGGENYPSTAGCHANHPGVCLPVPIVMLFGIGNVPGGGGNDYLRPAAGGATDDPRH